MKKHSNRAISLLLTLTLALGFMATLPATAADEDTPGVTELSVSGVVPGGLGVAIGQALEAAGHPEALHSIRRLTVSGEISSVDFKYIRDALSNDIVYLDIRNVSYLGNVNSALSQCRKLEWVKLPWLTDVPYGFFSECTALKTVGDAEGVVDLRSQNPAIGSRAFYACSAAEKVLLPESAALGDLAFYGCYALRTMGVSMDTAPGVIDLTSPRLTFGAGVFTNCRGMEWVKFYDGVEISDQMFFGCNNLKTVGDIEGIVDLRGAMSFGASCFRTCNEITAVLLADNAYISQSMFEACFKLDTVGNTPGVVDLRGVQRHFGDYTFYGCPAIKWVKLPENARLPISMFLSCTGLTTIGDAEGVVDLSGCESNSLNTFGDAVFSGCSSIEWVKFPKDAVLTYQMFFNCIKLKTAGETEGVLDLRDIMSFGSSATFGSCRVVEKIMLRDGAILGQGLFTQCVNLKTAGEKDGVLDLRNVREFAQMAFYQCQSVETALLPVNAALPSNIFNGCTKLRTVGSGSVWADGVADLRAQNPGFGSGIFGSCAIEKALLPGGAVLGDSMFYNNRLLKTVGNTDGIVDLRGVKSFGSASFSSCTGIERVLLADGAELTRSLFESCSGLKTIGNTEGIADLRKVAKLDELTFNHCAAIEKVLLTDHAALPRNVFSNCARLDEINLQDGQQFSYGFLSGCGFDFTDVSGYPAEFTESLDYYAPGQRPVIYFTLSVGYDTQVVEKGGEFVQPVPVLRTRHGMEFGELVTNKAEYKLWLSQTVSKPSVSIRTTRDGKAVSSVDTNTPGVYVITYSIPDGFTANRSLLTFTVTVRDEEDPWLRAWVTTPNIVETLSAYLNIATESQGYENEALTAYLMVEGAEMYPTAIVNGAGRMYLEKAPPAGTYALVIKTSAGLEAGRCEMTAVVYDPASLWEPKLRRDEDGSVLIEFSEVVSAKDGKFDNETTAGGKSVKCSQPSAKTLKLAAQYDSLPAGTVITAAGVKYPNMFPSYSFTFTLRMK